MSSTKRDYPELEDIIPWEHDFDLGLDVIFAIRRINWGISLERGPVKPTKFYRYSPLFQAHRITFRRWLLEWHIHAYVPRPERYVVDDGNGPTVRLPAAPRKIEGDDTLAIEARERR